MKTRRYSEVQIFRILKEVDAGSQVVDIARKQGVSPATIHRWKGKYGGITLSELKRLKVLGEENARLKRIVAQQALDNELLREINYTEVCVVKSYFGYSETIPIVSQLFQTAMLIGIHSYQ
jgi:putative transposase